MPLTTERLRSRHPFQLFMLAASTFYGVGGLLTRNVRPGTIQEAIGAGGTVVWQLFLAIGSAAALAGIFWRVRGVGLLLEGLGCLSAGTATLFYAVIALATVGPSAALSTCVLVGFGSACVVRAWQLNRVLNRAVKEQDRRQEE